MFGAQSLSSHLSWALILFSYMSSISLKNVLCIYYEVGINQSSDKLDGKVGLQVPDNPVRPPDRSLVKEI